MRFVLRWTTAMICLKEAGTRNIREYNDKFIKRKLNPQKGHQYLPFIVLVIDEFADLIMTAGKEIEMPIARLAQLARAVGIHLIIATQRPSVNIITGTIKANFPARIAFKVSSKIDSRTILDTGGAEQLIGKGDMLVSYNGEITTPAMCLCGHAGSGGNCGIYREAARISPGFSFTGICG